jgi:hypothetical protein
VHVVFGDELLAIYLGGSFSTGEFVEGASDYDLLVIVTAALTEERAATLSAMHRALRHEDERTTLLEGDYVPRTWLIATGTTRPVHWFRRGELHRPEFMLSADNVANMHDHGITVYGPPAESQLPAVTPDQVRAAVRTMMAETPDASSEGSAAKELLDVARSLRALETGQPTSRKAGLEWGLTSMDPRWRAALRRAADVAAGAVADPEERTLRAALMELRASLGLRG